MKTIGIDLGTSDTYIFAWDSEGWSMGARPKPLILPGIGDDGGGIATVVLYEDEKPLCIGNLAESEYFAHPNAGRKRRISAQFKPEIGRGDALALRAATDFLALLAQALPRGVLEGAAVYAGIPARARRDFAIALGKCFVEAGWPQPVLAREPDAALVSCLDLGVLSVADIGRRSLILDFGGGTLDYAAVESLNVLSDGGDALYGGRLFDDLFYQIFCARNPDFAAGMRDNPFAYYAHWLECKRQKEIFSRLVSADAGARASLRLAWRDRDGAPHEAFASDFGRDDFIAAAEHFTPTPELLRLLDAYGNSGALGERARELLLGREIPLLGWFDDLLAAAPARGEIEKTVLTGGSSRWFFVPEAARRSFPAAKVVQSDRDNEDIAYGLALYPALAQAGEKARGLLEGKMAAFCSRETEIARRELMEAAERLIAQAAGRIAARDALPALEAARDSGRTLEELERAIAENIRGDGELAQLFANAGHDLASRIRARLDADFKRWLAENGVPLAAGVDMPENVLDGDFFEGLRAEVLKPGDLDEFMLKRLLPSLAALSAAGLIAHALEPLSIAVGGGAVFGGAWLMGRLAPAVLRRRKLPRFMLGEKMRAKIAAKISAHIEEHLRSVFAGLEKSLATRISGRIRASLRLMIDNLGIFNQISPLPEKR